jgi:hypothetical protein
MLRELITINPRPRANPRKKRKHRATYRRNPRGMGLSIKSVTGALVPALIGGAGAFAIDVGISRLPFIPEDWKVGNKRTLLRAGVAIGLGMVSRFVVPQRFRRYVDAATAGSLLVTAYDAIRAPVLEKWPDLLGAYTSDLSAYERVNYSALPAIERLSARGGMSAYVGSDELNGMIPAVR